MDSEKTIEQVFEELSQEQKDEVEEILKKESDHIILTKKREMGAKLLREDKRKRKNHRRNLIKKISKVGNN